MRIAQVAPLTEAVPPKLYGGTERVVYWLTEELVALGHEVTLFASGDSSTSAKLEAMWPRALRLDGSIRDANALHMTGQADSFATVDQAKRALDASGYFGTIQVTHAKAGSDPNKVDFRLDATFKDAISTAVPDSDE